MLCFVVVYFVYMENIDLNFVIVFDVLLLESSVIGVVCWLGLSMFVMSCMFMWLCVVIGD